MSRIKKFLDVYELYDNRISYETRLRHASVNNLNMVSIRHSAKSEGYDPNKGPDKIEMRLVFDRYTPGIKGYNGSQANRTGDIITLDSEDIEYFYNKYSKLAKEELDNRINILRFEYSKHIKD